MSSRIIHRIPALILIIATAALTSGFTDGEYDVSEEARRLHASAILIDGHNDLPWALRNASDFNLNRYDLNLLQSRFQTDIPRLRQGGVGAQFWAAYIPCSGMNNGTSYETTLEQIDLIHRMVAKYPDTFQEANTADEIRAAWLAGKIASPIGVEGGHAIEDSLDKLRHLYEIGARYMTLTHNCTNGWADSATDSARHGGLSDFGRDVVREMNRLGMMVDISHVSADAMRDVLEVTQAPVVATHSGAWSIRNHNRNVPDDVLAALPANGGMVMVVLYSGFVVYTGRGDVDDVLNHIDHIVNLAGIDHVGIGGDYDGAPTFPRNLSDVSGYPYITQGLLNRGYSAEDIRKILGENLLRVLSKVEEVSRN